MTIQDEINELNNGRLSLFHKGDLLHDGVIVRDGGAIDETLEGQMLRALKDAAPDLSAEQLAALASAAVDVAEDYERDQRGLYYDW